MGRDEISGIALIVTTAPGRPGGLDGHGISLRAETEGQDEPRVEVEPDRRAILWQATAWRPCAGGSEAVNWQATLDLPRDSND